MTPSLLCSMAAHDMEYWSQIEKLHVFIDTLQQLEIHRKKTVGGNYLLEFILWEGDHGVSNINLCKIIMITMPSEFIEARKVYAHRAY